MGRKGLLIDYEYCTGCHTCELACQMEHGLPTDRWGIKLTQIGPWVLGEDNYQYSFFPMPTDLCNLCAERVAEGKQPTCVKHCLSQVIRYGEVEGFSAQLQEKPKQMLFVLE